MNLKSVAAGLGAVAVLLGASTAWAEASDGAPLRLLGRTEVPGFEGDFDHFGIDLRGNRLFLAGEDMGTLEVFDLKSGKHLKTVQGLEEPHAVQYLPESNRLVISNSGNGLSKVLDGRNYAVLNTIKIAPGADVMKYDPASKQLWFITGGKNGSTKLPRTTLSMVDAASGKTRAQLDFDTDFTEAIAFEQKGHRAFVNVAGRHEIAVIDKRTSKVIATWPVKEGQNNAPIALDEAHKRLFVVTRKPFKLVVVDTDTGASVASFDAPQRTNDVIFDPVNHRLYLTGDDHVAVFAQHDADRYEEIARVPSDKGAKTAVYVPELKRLFVAVAGKAPVKAGVLQYEVLPAAHP